MTVSDGSALPNAIASMRLISISHHTAPLEALERVALDDQRKAELGGRLAETGLETLLLSTCHRTELYWRSRGQADDAGVEAAFAAAAGGVLPAAHRTAGPDVARHLFRVSSGLESMVIGEPEVLGQVRDTLTWSGANEVAGPMLVGLVNAALRCGRRARAETAIGEGAVSIASVAAQWLLSVMDSRASRSVMVLGLGVTGLAVARHLRAEGVGRLVLVNRTPGPVEAAAMELKCEWAPLDQLAGGLAGVDAVIVSLAAQQPVLTPAVLDAARGGRDGRPLVVIDLSMPRAADPALGAFPHVALHDLSGLEAVANENHARRSLEVPRVEALIERELAAFERWARQQSLRPLMTSMRHRAERICRAELEQALANGPLDEMKLQDLTRRIVDLMVAAHAAVLQEPPAATDPMSRAEPVSLAEDRR